MKILVAGATGAIGHRLIPLLIACGYEVSGTTRAAEKAALLQKLGASPVVVDALDREGLAAAVRAVQPDVVIHQLTDLSARDFSANSRLRREGTRNLVDATRAVGLRFRTCLFQALRFQLFAPLLNRQIALPACYRTPA